MGTDSTSDISPQTIERLQELIRANIDSFDGFQESAEEISDDNIANLFREIASERASLAAELQEYVEWNGEEAARKGSFTAAIHRTWIEIRSKVNGGDPYIVLAEAEKGEDYIRRAYEEALKSTSGTALNGVLLTQYVTVKSGHDRVRDLRDAYKPRD